MGPAARTESGPYSKDLPSLFQSSFESLTADLRKNWMNFAPAALIILILAQGV